jgi:hypothetical protein
MFRYFQLSQAKFANDQYTYSRTSYDCESSRFTSVGRIPFATTYLHCAWDPAVMFDIPHAASNCSYGKFSFFIALAKKAPNPRSRTSYIALSFELISSLRMP